MQFKMYGEDSVRNDSKLFEDAALWHRKHFCKLLETC